MTQGPRNYAVLFLSSLLIGFFVPLLWSGPLEASALTNPYTKARSWDEAVIQYHLKVNKTTNEYLKKLTNQPQPDVSFPGSPEKCGKKNVSTYCLSVVLTEQLHFLETDLVKRKGQTVGISEVDLLDNAIQENISRRKAIETEIESARHSLDLVLALYDQVQVVYPIHEEYLSLIKNLEKYRDALGKLRDQIELYPSKFNDAVTAQCE